MKKAKSPQDRYADTMREQGFYRMGVWIPKTDEAKHEIAKLAERLRRKHLAK